MIIGFVVKGGITDEKEDYRLDPCDVFVHGFQSDGFCRTSDNAGRGDL